MSFFKKMTKEFDELKSTLGKGDGKKEQKHEGKRTPNQSLRHCLPGIAQSRSQI
jgi:hypothetical protein